MRAAAVILSADDYDAIMETLGVLADADLVRAIVVGESEIRRGDVATPDKVAEAVRATGRLPE